MPPPTRLNKAQLEHVLRKAGWDEKLIPVMSAIGMAESSGRLDAYNPGRGANGKPTVEQSIGPWQINMHPSLGRKYDRNKLASDPVYNAQAAKEIYNSQGLKAWGAYTDGRYKKYFSGKAEPDQEYTGEDTQVPEVPPLEPVQYTPLLPERELALAYINSQNARNETLARYGKPTLPPLQQLGSGSPAPAVAQTPDGLVQGHPLFNQYAQWATGKRLLDSPEVQQQFLGQIQQQLAKTQVNTNQVPQTPQIAPIEQPEATNGMPQVPQAAQPQAPQQPQEPEIKERRYTIGFSDKPDGISNKEWFIQNLVGPLASEYGLEAIDVENTLRKLDFDASIEEGGNREGGGALSKQGKDGSYTFVGEKEFVDRVKGWSQGKRDAFTMDLASGKFAIDQLTPGEISEQYGIDPEEVQSAIFGQDPRYAEAAAMSQQNVQTFNKLKEEYKADKSNLTDTEQIIELRARKDMGLIDEDKANKLIAAEREGVREIVKDSDTEVAKTNYNLINTIWSAIGKTAFTADEDTFKYKPYEQAKYDYARTLAESAGGAQKYVQETKDARISGIGPLAEITKTFGRYGAKLIGTGIEATAALNDVADQVQQVFTPKYKDFNAQARKDAMNAAASWRKMVDEDLAFKRGEHYKVNWVTNELAEGVAQFAAQTVLAPFTGGASIFLPMAEASMAQYRQAYDADAAAGTRVLAATVGAVAGVPDILLKASWLKNLAPGGVTKFLNNMTESVAKKFIAAFGLKEGKKVAADTMGAFLKNAVKKGGIGFGVEGFQEYTEDVLNDTLGKYTYNPKLTWEDVFVPTDEKLRGYFAAAATGAIGGTMAAKSDRQVSKAQTEKIQVDGLTIATPKESQKALADAMSYFETANEKWDKSKAAFENSRKEKTQEGRRAARQKAGELYAEGLAEFNKGNDLYRTAQEQTGIVGGKSKTVEIGTTATPAGPLAESTATKSIKALSTNNEGPFTPLSIEDVQRRERTDSQKALLEKIRETKKNAAIPSQPAQVETEPLVQDKPTEAPIAKPAPKLKNRTAPEVKVAPKLKNKEAVAATAELKEGMAVNTPKGKGVLVKPVGKKGWQVDYNPKTGKDGNTKYQSSGRFATSDLTVDETVKTLSKSAKEPNKFADFPNVVINTSVSKVTKNENYTAAKKDGDVEAADKVVLDTLSLDKAQQIKETYPDAYITPIGSDPAISKNALPAAYGRNLAELAGMPLDNSIVQTNTAFRTNAPAAWKVISRSKFSGKVVPGRKYLLADDVVATGGVLRDAKEYIESKGGIVVGATTLASAGPSQYSSHGTILAHEQRVQNSLKKFDQVELDKLLKEFGLPGINSLTNSEAGYIGSHSSLKNVRHDLTKALQRKDSLEAGTFAWPSRRDKIVQDLEARRQRKELKRVEAVRKARAQEVKDQNKVDANSRPVQLSKEEQVTQETSDRLRAAMAALTQRNNEDPRTLSSAAIDNQQNRQEVATVTYAPPYTLQILGNNALTSLRGKEITKQRLEQTIKSTKPKPPEQMLVDWILNEYFENNDKINYDLFEAYTRLHILPLSKIEDPLQDYTRKHYALNGTYLSRSLSDMTDHIAILFNAPLDHAYAAHWPEAFKVTSATRYGIKKLQGPIGKPIYAVGFSKDIDNLSDKEPLLGGFTIVKDEKEATAIAESLNKLVNDKGKINTGLAFHGRFFKYEDKGVVINIETQGEGLQAIVYPNEWTLHHPAMFWNPSKAGDQYSIHGKYLTKAMHNVSSEEEMVIVHYLRQLQNGDIDTDSDIGGALRNLQFLHDELSKFPMELVNFPALYDRPGVHKTIFDKNMARFAIFDDDTRQRMEEDYKKPIDHPQFKEYVALMEQIHEAWPAFVKDYFTVQDRQFAAYAKETKINGSKYKYFQKRLLTEMLQDFARQGYKEYWIPTAETGAIAQQHLNNTEIDRLNEYRYRRFDPAGGRHDYKVPAGTDPETLPLSLEAIKRALVIKWRDNAPMITPIAENYQMQVDMFKALRPDATLVFDENGLSYYKTSLTKEDAESPIVVYDAAKISSSFAEREAIKDAEVNNIFIADVTSEIDANGDLKMSPQAAEMLRQVADELNGYETPIWDAQFWRRNNFAPYLRALEQYVKEAKEYDYTDAELAGVVKLINDVKSMNASDKGILYVNESGILHEKGHQLRYANSIFESSIQNYYTDFDKTFNATKNIAEKAYNSYFKDVYFAGQDLKDLSRTDLAILQEEIFMSIVDGTNSAGLTVQEQAEFIKNDLDAYVEKNGEKILDDLETLVNEKDNKSTLVTTIQSLRSADSVQSKPGQDSSSVQEGSTTGNKQQPGESPGQPGPADTAEKVQRPAPDAKSDKKLRATPQTIAENTSINIEDLSEDAREYTPKSRSVEANKAEEWLKKTGFENAYVQVFALPANMAATAKRMAVMEYIDAQTAKHLALGDTGRAKEWNEKLLVLTNSLSPEYTEYGQAISQLARWSDLNPKGIVAHVESKLAQAGKSGTLTLGDQALLRERAALVAQLEAQAKELENPTIDFDVEDGISDAWSTLRAEFPTIKDANKTEANQANIVADADIDLSTIITPDKLASLAQMPDGDTAYHLMDDFEDTNVLSMAAKREDFKNVYEFFLWERGIKQKAGGNIARIDSAIAQEATALIDRVRSKELLFNKLTDGLINVEINVAELNGNTARANEYRTALKDDNLRALLVQQKRYLQEKVFNKWKEGLQNKLGYNNEALRYYILNLLTTKLPVFTQEGLKFKKRDGTTGTNLIPYNGAALQQFIDNDTESLDFFEKYTAYVSENALAGITLSDGLTRDDGAWGYFAKNSPYKIMMESVQQSPWCIAGDTMASSYLQQGDFHIFYTNDQQGRPVNPRLAIRMEGQPGAMKLASDLRGVADTDQNVESEFYDELEAKIKEVAVNESQYKLDEIEETFEDQRALTKIYNKHNAGKELTNNELEFILESNKRIKKFGYQPDPRIDIVKKSIPPAKILAGYLGAEINEIADFSSATPEQIGEAKILVLNEKAIALYDEYGRSNEQSAAYVETAAKIKDLAAAGHLDNITQIYVGNRNFDISRPGNTGTLLIDYYHENLLDNFKNLAKINGTLVIQGYSDNAPTPKLPETLEVTGSFKAENATIHGLKHINAKRVFARDNNFTDLETINDKFVGYAEIDLTDSIMLKLHSIGNDSFNDTTIYASVENIPNLETVYGDLTARKDYSSDGISDLPNLKKVTRALSLKNTSAPNLEYAGRLDLTNTSNEQMIIGVESMPAPTVNDTYVGRITVETDSNGGRVVFPRLKTASSLNTLRADFPKLEEVTGAVNVNLTTLPELETIYTYDSYESSVTIVSSSAPKLVNIGHNEGEQDVGTINIKSSDVRSLEELRATETIYLGLTAERGDPLNIERVTSIDASTLSISGPITLPSVININGHIRIQHAARIERRFVAGPIKHSSHWEVNSGSNLSNDTYYKHSPYYPSLPSVVSAPELEHINGIRLSKWESDPLDFYSVSMSLDAPNLKTINLKNVVHEVKPNGELFSFDDSEVTYEDFDEAVRKLDYPLRQLIRKENPDTRNYSDQEMLKDRFIDELREGSTAHIKQLRDFIMNHDNEMANFYMDRPSRRSYIKALEKIDKFHNTGDHPQRVLSSAAKPDGLSRFTKAQQDALIAVGKAKQEAMRKAGPVKFNAWQSALRNDLSSRGIDPSPIDEAAFKDIFREAGRKQKQENAAKELAAIKKSHKDITDDEARELLRQRYAKRAEAAKIAAENRKIIAKDKDRRNALDIAIDNEIEGLEVSRADVLLSKNRIKFFQQYAEKLPPTKIHDKYIEAVQIYIRVAEDLKKERAELKVQKSLSPLNITRVSTEKEKSNKNKEIAEIKRQQMKETHHLRLLVEHYTHRPASKLQRAADWYKRVNKSGEAMLTTTLQTATHNLIAQRGTKLINAMETGFELAYAKMFPNLFATSELGISKSAAFWDIVKNEAKSSSFPAVRKALADFHDGEADFLATMQTIIAHKERVVQGLLAYNPDLYDEMIGKFTYGAERDLAAPIDPNLTTASRRVEKTVRGLESFVHFATGLNRLQEKHFRFATFMGSLATDMKAAGMDMDTVVETGDLKKIPRTMLARAVKRSLEDTFGEDIPKDNDLGRLLNGASNTMSWIPFMLNPLLFRRFFFNSAKFMIDHSPLIVYKVVTKEGFTHRDMAKFTTGMTMFAFAIALAGAFGSDDDDPSTITVMGNTFKLTAYNPISYFMVLGTIVRRMMKGKPPLAQKEDLWKFIGQDPRYPNLAIEWWRALFNLGSTTDDDKYVKFGEQSEVLGAKGLTAFLRPLVTMKDMIAQFNQEERILRDYTGEGSVGEFKKVLPLSEILTRLATGVNTPAKEDVVTGKPIEKYSPLLNQLGFTFVNDNDIGASFSPAEEYLHYYALQQRKRGGDMPYRTPEERKQSALTSQLYLAIDKGNNVADQILKYQSQGRITDRQAQQLNKANSAPSGIVRKALNVDILHNISALAFANEQEYQEILPILLEKAKKKGKDLSKEEYDALLRIMP